MQWRQIQIADEDLGAFIARVAPHEPIPAHLQVLVDLLQRAFTEPVRAIVSMPPRCGKSITLRRALAWAVRRWPDRLNGLVMYGSRIAQAQSRLVRRMVRADGVVLEEGAEAVDDWRTPEDGGLVATGVGAALTGRGLGGVLICDDTLKNREEAESPTQREKAWETFAEVAFTRLEPPCGSCVVVGTRWHNDDVIGRILERNGTKDFPTFEVINLPAIRDEVTNEPAEDGIALWPERFPLDRLREIRSVLGPYGWNALYQGQPRPRTGRVFGDPGRYEVAHPGARIVLSLDCAGTAGDRSDYTACVALGCVGFGEKTVADVLEVARWRDEPQRVAPYVYAFQQKWGGGAVVIECTRDGKALHRALLGIEPRLWIHEIPPIGDKFTRAQPVAAAWNDGRVRVPMQAPWLADFMAEVAAFTGVGDKRDDMCDALSQAYTYALTCGRPAKCYTSEGGMTRGW